MELVPENVSSKDLKDEANRRAAKCGYCTADGLPPYRTRIMNNPPTEQYRRNYDQIDWSK